MIPRVVQVFPTQDFSVYVYFDDGRVKLYDMKDIVGEGVFSKIEKIEDFIGKCTVINDTLAWDLEGSRNETKCIDIDPESIYLDGLDVADPLTVEAVG